MVLDAAALGAVFIGSWLAVTLPADASAISRLGETTALLPLAASLGLGVAISILRSILWRWVFPYDARPTRIRRFLGLRAGFRTHVAEGLGATFERALVVTGGDRREAVGLATSMVFHRHAEAPIRDWVRRRHQAFGTAVDVALAIALGVGFSVAANASWSPARVLVVLVLGAVGWMTLANGLVQRAEAERMEELWFAERASGGARATETGD